MMTIFIGDCINHVYIDKIQCIVLKVFRNISENNKYLKLKFYFWSSFSFSINIIYKE